MPKKIGVREKWGEKRKKKLRYEHTLKLIQNKEKLKNDKENKIDEENTHKSMPIVECWCTVERTKVRQTIMCTNKNGNGTAFCFYSATTVARSLSWCLSLSQSAVFLFPCVSCVHTWVYVCWSHVKQKWKKAARTLTASICIEWLHIVHKEREIWSALINVFCFFLMLFAYVAHVCFTLFKRSEKKVK